MRYIKWVFDWERVDWKNPEFWEVFDFRTFLDETKRNGDDWGKNCTKEIRDRLWDGWDAWQWEEHHLKLKHMDKYGLIDFRAMEAEKAADRLLPFNPNLGAEAVMYVLPLTPVRVMGGKIVGSKGSGKTLFAAWQTVHDQVVNKQGSIVIDPLGKMSEYILQLISQGDPYYRDFVHYVPIGGTEINGRPAVNEMSFLHEGDEPLQDKTARVNYLWKVLHPEQEVAPILGMPAITGLTNYAGMLLAAMGCQLVPDAKHLLRDPKAWEGRIRKALEEYPWDLAAPAHYFLNVYPKLSAADKRSESMSFIRMLDPFELNSRLSAQFGGGNNNLLSLMRLAEMGHIVIYDFSEVPKPQKQLMLTWVFHHCMELFRARNNSQYRDRPVGFVVDELSFLAPRDNTLLEDDFEELLARLCRNYKIMVTLTYQELTQPSERMQQVLDQTGWSMFGSTGDPESARKLARLMDVYKPKMVKDTRKQYHDEDRKEYGKWATYQVAEDVNTYYSVQEQEEMNLQKHRRRPGLRFALMDAMSQGGSPQYCFELDITKLLKQQPFSADIEQLKFDSMWKADADGVGDIEPIDTILQRIRQRLPGAVEPEQTMPQVLLEAALPPFGSVN